MLKIHVLRNDTNCFKMSICKGRHRNASFLSVPLTDAISTEKWSKGKHWHQRKYDIETQDAYNLSGAYQLVFSLGSYLQHKCSTTFSCFQLLTIYTLAFHLLHWPCTCTSKLMWGFGFPSTGKETFLCPEQPWLLFLNLWLHLEERNIKESKLIQKLCIHSAAVIIAVTRTSY